MTRPPYEFAGFTFPRKVPFYRGKKPGRRAAWCFSYRQTPPPVPSDGANFYHDSDFAPGLRWTWCDEVDDVRIRHQGWHSGPDGMGETIRGIVYRLPRSRGFLAGWSMGNGMVAELSRTVYTSERKAAYAADHEAERVAEAEREREEWYRAGQRAGEAWREAMSEAIGNAQSARDARDATREALRVALALRGAPMVPPDVEAATRSRYRDSLSEWRHYAAEACEARRKAWQEFRKATPDYDPDALDAFREGAAL